MNLVRAELSKLCIYAFVKRQKRDQEFNNRIDLIANIRGGPTFVSSISSVKRVNEYTRSLIKLELDLSPGESRGYCKYHTPGKSFKQAKTALLDHRRICRSSILTIRPMGP